MTQISKTCEFTRVGVGSQRVSTDAMNALAAWEAMAKNRSYVIKAGEESRTSLVAELSYEDDDDQVSDHLVACCKNNRVGAMQVGT